MQCTTSIRQQRAELAAREKQNKKREENSYGIDQTGMVGS